MREATWQEYVDRFWSYVDQKGPDDCWLWTKSTRGGHKRERRKKGTKGIYGQFWCQGKVWYAHRFAFASMKGPIPPGAEVDHICENTLCCNPKHLQAITPALNNHYRNRVVPRPGDDEYTDWLEEW